MVGQLDQLEMVSDTNLASPFSFVKCVSEMFGSIVVIIFY